MRLIIGVSDAPSSTAIAEFVRRMNWPEGSHGVIITAVEPVVMAVPGAFLATADLVEETLQVQRTAAARHVNGVAADLASTGLKLESRILDGDPRDVLVEACRSEHADLIILGAHDRTALARLLMGSVASHVVTHAPCSTLVVRRPAVS